MLVDLIQPNLKPTRLPITEGSTSARKLFCLVKIWEPLAPKALT